MPKAARASTAGLDRSHQRVATKRGTTSNKDDDCQILAELDPQRPVDVADPDYIAQKFQLTEQQRQESELDKLSYKNRANDYWLVEAILSHKRWF